jgi:parallel beta-helix repeat protein
MIRGPKAGLLGVIAALTLIAGLIAPQSVSANPDMEITSLPFTADVAGETYYLAADLTCSDPDAAGITIAAGGITIDGQGHKITGSATNDSCEWGGETEPCTASGIYSMGHDNVVIRDLEIENFCTGIALKGNGPDKVEGNTIDGCSIHDNGFNTASSNGSEMVTHGIHACHIIELSIIDNDIYTNEGTGVSGADGGNNIFIYGGQPESKKESAAIDGNRLHHNAKAGFWTKMMFSYSEITNNEVYENGYRTGITDDVKSGIILRCKLSDDNLISGNTIYDNDQDGIYLAGNRNTAENNILLNNGRYGINIGRSNGSRDNALVNNRAYGNGENDISVTGGVTGNTGNNNTCDSTDNYTDDGAGGCAYQCGDSATIPLVIGLVCVVGVGGLTLGYFRFRRRKA